MNIRKQKVLLCVLLLAVLLLSGCGRQSETEIPAEEVAVEYTNLTDSASRELLQRLLAAVGVVQGHIDVLFERIDLFNASVKPEWLTDCFEEESPTDTKYDPYDMQDAWAEKYGTFPCYNCRITALEVFGDYVRSGNAEGIIGEDTLFRDLETMQADPDALCGDSAEKSCALFAPVETTDSTDTQTHLEALRQAWASRGVAFEDSGAIRLVSVVFHEKLSETENTLFIGHTGVLLPAVGGTVYFLEKVAFQEPYRLLRFSSRAELRGYLMAKYDVSWGQETARPFVMENDRLM